MKNAEQELADIQNKVDNQPNGERVAYPQTRVIRLSDDSKVTVSLSGLTKREQIAAMAMQGLLADGADKDHKEEDLAGWACIYADALLAELEKPKGGSDE